MAFRMKTTLGTIGLFAALALTAGCDMHGNPSTQSGVGPATRGNAAAPMGSTATGQSAVTNQTMGAPGMMPAGGGNRPYNLGADPNFPGGGPSVSGKPSGTGP
jgi:hypothetical protein